MPLLLDTAVSSRVNSGTIVPVPLTVTATPCVTVSVTAPLLDIVAILVRIIMLAAVSMPVPLSVASPEAPVFALMLAVPDKLAIQFWITVPVKAPVPLPVKSTGVKGRANTMPVPDKVKLLK